MKYNPTVRTYPLKCAAGELHEIEVPFGDTYYIALTEWENEPLTMEPAREDIQRDKVIRNTVYLGEQNKSIGNLVTEGEDLVFTIKITEPLATDLTIDWVITGTTDLPDEMVTSQNATLDGFDYTTLHREATVADIPTMTGTATLLAGDTSVDVVIPTIDDVIWTGGENTFKCCDFTISNLSDTDLLLDRDKVFGLVMDSSVTPTVEGVVELWVRMDKELHLERLGGLSDAVTYTIGYDDDGMSKLETGIFDDIDIHSIAFRVSEDFTATLGEDMTAANTYIKAVIKTGRREL